MARKPSASARLFLAAGPGALVVLAVTSTALGLVPAAIAVALRGFVDGLTGGGGVTGAAVLFMLAMGATAALPELVAYLSAQCCRRIGHDGTRLLYDRVNADPTMHRLERPEYQDEVQFATEATDFAPMLVLEAALGGVQCLVTVLSLWWVMASAHPLAGALAVVGAVPAVLVQRRLARRRVEVRRALVPVQRRREAYRGLIISPVAGKELRLFGLGPFFRDRMLADLHTANLAERDLDRGVLRWQLGLAAVQAALVVAVVTLTARAATAGDLSAGEVTALIASFTALGGVTDSLAGHLARGREGMRTLAAFDAVDATSGGPGAVGTRPVPPLTGGIRFEDVWFRYGEDLPWVLRGVTLDITAGSSVALVGINGAGKSTLVKLLCGLYRPTSGRITWNGVDLADCDPALLRDRIGAVFQDFMAYELTAHENIAIGSVEALEDRARTVAAARLAGVDADLGRLPRGYATLLSRLLHRSPVNPDGEPGVVLSGGQWQRLALARMLMRHDRDLLILDEPTAGLDAHAEHRIHEVVRTAMIGRARLLISHRLSAVRHADRIHVLDGGRITECGDHHQLLSDGGTYAELFRVQASGYLDPETAGR